VATLLLPVLLAVVLGLGALLGSLGDASGAVACGRIGLGLGVAWLMAIVATVAVTACVALVQGPRRPHGPPPRPAGRRRRRRKERSVADRLAAEREARERPA
jgi:hypothetical protein